MRQSCLLHFVLLCLLLIIPQSFAAQMDRPSSSGDPAQLEDGRQPSRISSKTAAASRQPSGQGTHPMGMPGRMLEGQAPLTAPLYVPGKHLNNGRPFTGSPAWAQQGYPLAPDYFPPFGANLFQGYFAGTYYEGMNKDYVIMPGDRILVHIWGAQTYTDTLMVDQQGNIFLPEVGPVTVAGMRHGELENSVRSFLSSVFKTNMQVYVNLLTSQPVAVYVTGFVTRPGRYAGGTSDSVLYYLDRAGGIIPERGSYRDILVQRGGKTVGRADLYSFILDGKLANTPLREGDVIVVGPRGDYVAAGGLIPQQASYESKGKNFSGAELIHFAAPLPAASHVSVSGTRGANPFHVYLSLQEFASFSMKAHDRVEFLADKPGETIMVSVTGAIQGATRYPIKRNTTLRGLLAHVPVDAQLANLSGIYLKRKSVVEQQRKAIADSLYRLENSVLTASSATAEEAQIRVSEAQLVQNFVERVGALEPDGVVVVTRNGATSDIILEEGDEIVVPQRSDVVQISGEVMIPKAVVYSPDLKLKDYIANSGGFTDRADSGNILAVHPNGEIQKASRSGVQPGDLLLVMPRYDSKGFQIFKDLMQILYQVAIATKVVVSL